MHLLRGDMRSVQRLDSSAEIVFFYLLGEPGIVHGHVDSLLLLHLGLLALLLLSKLLLLRFLLRLSPLGFRRLIRLLSKDDTEIKSLVD